MRAMESEEKKVTSKQKMYSGVVPNSLELIELQKIAPDTFKELYNMNVCTALVNVAFDNSYYEYVEGISYKKKKSKRGNFSVSKQNTKRGKKLMDIPDLRKKLYNDGFKMDGLDYVEYKRSGSKAKDGDHLFIQKAYYEHMKTYSRLGINFPENDTDVFDLTSAKAYESLVGSAIETTIDIKPEEIFIVRDIKNTFKASVNIVTQVLGEDGKKRLINTPTDDYDMTNDCLDGESLIDSSLVPKDEHGNTRGFILLRNTLLKSASFNTELHEFLKDKGWKENAFGIMQDLSKVKLVLTPNSLKIFKFGKYIDGNTAENVAEWDKNTWEYWINHVPTTFGIVKSEHISNYGGGNYNKMSYQMHNSLPIRKTDVPELLHTDFQYIKDMKNHVSVFRNYINNSQYCATAGFIDNMLVNSDKFAFMDVFKDYRNDTIKNYKTRMKMGKTSVKGDYATICSMPWEFLNSILHQEPEDFKKFKETLIPIQTKGEIYCSALEEGERVTIFRSPHICASNVIVGQNKSYTEFTTWFNFTRGIIVVTPWVWDIMERGNSLDFDSDSAIVVREKKIYERALEVQNFATPVHDIPNDPVQRHNCMDDLAKLDGLISVNKIGEICNLAQILNSYYWNEYFKDEPDIKVMEEIYNQIIILAILSNIEIDKSKHVFDLDMEEILNGIKSMQFGGKQILITEEIEVEKELKYDELEEIHYTTDYLMFLTKSLDDCDDDEKEYYENELSDTQHYLNELKKVTVLKERPVRPYFMKNIMDGVYAWDNTIECPMNYIVKAIEKEPCKPDHNTKKLNLFDYLNLKEIPISDRIGTTLEKMHKICMEYAKAKKGRKEDFKRVKEEDKVFDLENEEKTVKALHELSISPNTMMNFIYQIIATKVVTRTMKNGEWKYTYKPRYPELYENRLTLIGILNKSHWDIMKWCFDICADGHSELIQDDNGTIDIWGIKYREEYKENV
jgi:hypothetical protein